MSKPNWTPIRIRLGQLQPWSDNPRTSTKAQAKRILASFEKFGQVVPVVVGPDLSVYDGHQRLSALLTVHGPDYEIEARQSDRPLTDEERRALVLALANATGSWNWDSLSSWNVDTLKDWGFDKDTLKGWKSDVTALGEFLKSEQPTQDAETDISSADALREKWGVSENQLWTLGDHKLLVGDSYVVENINTLMGNEKAECVLTDPPYGMNLNTDYSNMPETRIASKTYERVEGDDKDFDASPFIALFDYCKEQFWWGADYYYPTLPLHGSWIVWDKRNENSDGLVGNHFEVCWSRTNHRRRMIRVHWSGVNARNQGTVRSHPTEKSIKVLCEILNDYTKEGMIVVDLFGGVGTTLAACESLKRKCRMIEKDPQYAAVAIQRWVDITGLTPALSDL